METTYLSEHFTLWEMVRSGTAIRNNICNDNPNEEEIRSLKALCHNVLEPLRKRFGTITVTSGWRSKKLNALLGGADDSQHLRGEAADIFISSQELAKHYILFIRDRTQWDQLIVERFPARHRNDPVEWLHVSYTTRRPNRKEILCGLYLPGVLPN